VYNIENELVETKVLGFLSFGGGIFSYFLSYAIIAFPIALWIWYRGRDKSNWQWSEVFFIFVPFLLLIYFVTQGIGPTMRGHLFLQKIQIGGLLGGLSYLPRLFYASASAALNLKVTLFSTLFFSGLCMVLYFL